MLVYARCFHGMPGLAATGKMKLYDSGLLFMVIERAADPMEDRPK